MIYMQEENISVKALFNKWLKDSARYNRGEFIRDWEYMSMVLP